MANLFKRQDWLLNAAVIFLSVASLAILYSMSAEYFWRQSIWFFAGTAIIFSFALIDWRSLMSYRWVVLVIYLAAIFALLITLIFAPTIRSSKSWIVIGPFQIQTSEFAKIALILILAYFFSRGHLGIARSANLLKSFIYLAIPAALVLAQPDFGTTIILLGIWLSFLLVSGIPWRHILIGILILAALSFLGWNYFLKDYQKERIKGLFNPEYDPLGINYSVTQSKIAIGSAGWLGKGFGQGSQVQLGFLPEAHNDFIFAAFVEEWGLLGGFLIIGAFGFAMFRIIKLGIGAENNFGRLLCLGTVMTFLIQFILNIGSNIGLFPVIGVPLPFFSYGGSSFLASSIMIGVIQGVFVRASFLRE